MKKIAMQGWGAQIITFDGIRAIPVNLTFVSDPTISTSYGQVKGNYTGVGTEAYEQRFYGGINTWFPWGYANHRGMTMYKNRIYQCINDSNPAQGEFYLGRWDGSGVFTHSGSEYETSEGRCGRGFELLSPSGGDAFKSNDLCLLEHNGNLFIVGAFWGSNDAGANSLVDDFGWTWDRTAYDGTSIYYRNYRTMSIDSNDKRIGSTPRTFAPVSDYAQYLGGCDAISFGNDIYFANWIDVIKFPGGSGIPEIISPLGQLQPSSRSFAVFPSNGYSNGVSQGSATLLMLSGSGLLQKVNPASGLSTFADLTSVSLGFNARKTDNWLARINSSTSEPCRSCLLMNHANQLHAFVGTEASGYRYLVCDGNPSGTTNWTDYSATLPSNVESLDGNIYGMVDPKNNQMYIAHVTQGNCGIYGHEGVNRSAGAISIYRRDGVQSWTEITSTMVGMPPRGMIIYNPTGPHAHIASGSNPTIYKSSDYAIVEYTLYDHYNRTVNATIEYSDDEGMTWNTARRFRSYADGSLQGSGTLNLHASPEGTVYPFYWDYVNDIGYNTKQSVKIRVRTELVR